MYNHYILAFDVGGLFTRGGVLNNKGELLTDTVSYYSSNSQDNREDLLNHLVEIICRQIGSIMDKYFVIDGIGFAFPGPFDYENGICFINGVNKFDSLYGVHLKSELLKRLIQQKIFTSRITPQFRMQFENNVSMFALGEWHTGKAKNYKKVMFLTLGNGTGSAFLDNGTIITNRHDVPPNGWVYCLPFRDSIIDDYISTRGIMQIANQLNVDPTLSLEQMAEAARLGNPVVKEVFQEFGQLLGEMLITFIRSFQPDALIFGGQIAKGYELYKEPLQPVLQNENVAIELTNETSYSTFIGVSKTFSYKYINSGGIMK